MLHKFSPGPAKSSFELVGLNRIMNKLYQLDKNHYVKQFFFTTPYLVLFYSPYGDKASKECKFLAFSFQD